jgi:hypothetical protein
VNEWLARASRGQLALFVGLLSALSAGVVVGLIFQRGWSGAGMVAVSAGIGGAILGSSMVYGLIRREVEAVGVLSGSRRRAVARASLWGAVPEDPETRAVAAKLAEHALAERQRRRGLGVVSSLVVLAMVVNLAVRASPWWWIGVAGVVALTVHGLFFLPRRLRRRMELLRAD